MLSFALPPPLLFRSHQMFSFALSSLAVPKEEFALRAYTFAQYTAEFGKVYADQERAEREVIFNKNKEKIIAHNKDARWTYTLAVNKFADMTSQEFKAHYQGYSKDSLFTASGDAEAIKSIPDVCGGPKAMNDTFDAFPIKDLDSLPTSVDWRTKKVVTPVKDQGGCGSCALLRLDPRDFSVARCLQSCQLS